MTQRCIFIVPVYNEEGSIRNVINTIYLLDKKDITILRTIIIDDGSTDSTPQILKELKNIYPSIEVITHSGNMGIAQVFESGLTTSVKIAMDDDIIIMLEGDNTNEPEAIPRMLKKINAGYDIVIASRFAEGGGFKGFPPIRKLISKWGNLILRYSLRIDGITDYTVFLRAYRAKIIKKFIEKYKDKPFETEGFTVNTELLVKTSAFTDKITEVPHFYNYTRKINSSKFRIIRTALEQLGFIYNRFCNTSR